MDLQNIICLFIEFLHSGHSSVCHKRLLFVESSRIAVQCFCSFVIGIERRKNEPISGHIVNLYGVILSIGMSVYVQ